jgi:glycosyltransferase involved in cell wall biosynthesis
MSLAVCVTVRNENDVARELAASLLQQTRLPDELVIVDGGSTDGTAATDRKSVV